VVKCFRADETNRKQLLNKGFKNETLQKILNVKQNYKIKLSCSTTRGGKATIREQQREFNNESKPLPDALLDYLNSIEILNRQSLPLRSNLTARFKNILIKMINFNYENEFNLENEEAVGNWLSTSFLSGKKEGEINYIFCDDEYLHQS
jgi:hypothetical protein